MKIIGFTKIYLHFLTLMATKQIAFNNKRAIRPNRKKQNTHSVLEIGYYETKKSVRFRTLFSPYLPALYSG